MKKYLLGKNRFYKANLHTHTTISDGRLSPQEIKEKYLALGYSVVAYTDHEVMVCHNDLTDERFLAINGYELSVRNENVFEYNKAYHINLWAENPDISIAPCFNADYIWLENSMQYVTEDMKKINYQFSYSVDAINKIVDVSRKSGFLACYNHPSWSLHTYREYSGLKGFSCVEVYNNVCEKGGFYDTDVPFETLLKEGEKVFPVASDDCHYVTNIGGGFTMIDAESLDYKSVISAIKNGNFYASSSPLINEMYIEDNNLIINTSPCKTVAMLTNRRYRVVNSGENITNTVIPLEHFLQKTEGVNHENDYFRIVLFDQNGKAYTKAYFLDDIK